MFMACTSPWTKRRRLGARAARRQHLLVNALLPLEAEGRSGGVLTQRVELRVALVDAVLDGPLPPRFVALYEVRRPARDEHVEAVALMATVRFDPDRGFGPPRTTCWGVNRLPLRRHFSGRFLSAFQATMAR